MAQEQNNFSQSEQRWLPVRFKFTSFVKASENTRNLVAPGPDWNTLTTFGQIAVKFCTYAYVFPNDEY